MKLNRLAMCFIDSIFMNNFYYLLLFICDSLLNINFLSFSFNLKYFFFSYIYKNVGLFYVLGVLCILLWFYIKIQNIQKKILNSTDEILFSS